MPYPSLWGGSSRPSSACPSGPVAASGASSAFLVFPSLGCLLDCCLHVVQMQALLQVRAGIARRDRRQLAVAEIVACRRVVQDADYRLVAVNQHNLVAVMGRAAVGV